MQTYDDPKDHDHRDADGQAGYRAKRKNGQREISTDVVFPFPHGAVLKQDVARLKHVFGPLGVNISVPSLRVNEQLRSIAELIGNGRRSALTLAPEVARDDMREQMTKEFVSIFQKEINEIIEKAL